MTEPSEGPCPECGKPLAGRWGNRCYACNGGGSPRSGETRKCPQCEKEFYVPRWKLNDNERRQGTYCSRACKYAQVRANGSGQPDWVRRLFTTYGITLDQYSKMLADQGGVCAICARPPFGRGKRLHVDHCHESGVVRGLLCANCNTAIGLMGDSPSRLQAAISYLRPSTNPLPQVGSTHKE